VDASAVPTALKVKWDLGLPVVEVFIDGHGPLNFVLDSGAAGYVLDQRVADALRLERIALTPDGRGVGVSAADGETYVPQAVRIHEFRSGPLVERDTGALVFDLSLIEQASGTRIDGLLPAEAFRGVLLMLDLAGETATVTAGELPPADDRDVLPLLRSPIACIVVEIGGNSCPVIIDTGGKTALVVPTALTQSLRFRSNPVVTGSHASLAGQTPAWTGRLDATIAWGRHEIVSPVIGLTAGDSASAGVDLLREFRITFDFSHSRVRFERSDDNGPISSRPVRGLGLGFLREDGAWSVRYVLDGSPAAQAGIHVGDCVETIDDRPFSEITLAQRQTMMDTKDALRLRIVGADGTTRDVTLPVVTLVE